jgi:hypothetical protein
MQKTISRWSTIEQVLVCHVIVEESCFILFILGKFLIKKRFYRNKLSTNKIMVSSRKPLMNKSFFIIHNKIQDCSNEG